MIRNSSDMEELFVSQFSVVSKCTWVSGYQQCEWICRNVTRIKQYWRSYVRSIESNVDWIQMSLVCLAWRFSLWCLSPFQTPRQSVHLHNFFSLAIDQIDSQHTYRIQTNVHVNYNGIFLKMLLWGFLSLLLMPLFHLLDPIQISYFDAMIKKKKKINELQTTLIYANTSNGQEIWNL